ncbi:MAG: Bcr/CflA family efflux MFS transporter [Alphaproteobacteria bacterium]
MNTRAALTPPTALIIGMTIASQLPMTIYLPAVPAMAADLGVPAAQVQLVVPAFLGAFAVAQLFVGPVSDAFGRRPVALLGLALLGLASVACAVAPDLATLVVARIAQAVGACVSIVVGRAIIRDTAEGAAAAKVMAWVAAAMGLGPAVAPLAGGYLLLLGDWPITFHAIALAAALILVAGMLRLRESLPPGARQPARITSHLRSYVLVARQRSLVGYALGVTCCSSAFVPFMVAAPVLLMEQRGVSPEAFGFFVLLVPGTFMVGSWIAGLIAPRVDPDRTIGLCFPVALTGVLVPTILGDAASSVVLVASMMLWNIGNAIIFVFCYARGMAGVAPSMAGAASGLMGFVHFGWSFVLSLVSAALPLQATWMGLTQTVTVALGALAFLLIARPWRAVARP